MMIARHLIFSTASVLVAILDSFKKEENAEKLEKESKGVLDMMTLENVLNAQKGAIYKDKNVFKLMILAKISIMKAKPVEDVTLAMLY